MSVAQTLTIGCYRLASHVRLRQTENGGMVALCDYPLRVVPLNSTIAQLLSLCTEERTCEQLAALMHLPLKRIEALCDQLRWKSLLEAGPIAPPITWPAISIVIPSYNRVNELERCLRTLFTLTYPHHLIEILVVNDASTDTTSTMLHQLAHEAKTYNMQLRSIHHAQQQGVAISRNTGAEAAAHDLIAYIDSDCVASPSWLTDLVPLFQDQRIAAVGGMIRGYDRRSMLGRYEDTCSSLYMGVRLQQVRLEGPLTYLPTANLLIRRSTWQQIGGFAPLTQGEDVDFCRRTLLSGASIRYVPQGIVYHDYRATLKSFLKIRAAYASAEAALFQRHPTERRILILPPAQATFAGLIIGGVWRMFCVLLFTKRKSLIGGEHDRGKPCHYDTRLHVAKPRDIRSIVVTGLAPICVNLTRTPRLASSQGTHKGMPLPDNDDARGAASGMGGASPCGCPGPHSTLKFTRMGLAPVMRQRSFTYIFMSIGACITALITTLFGTYNRLQKVRQQYIPITFITVFKATLRSNLAYTYHLCRHLTRYYTLPLLLLGLILFPFALLIAIMLCIVIGVDYWRLKPSMNLAEYALCAILNDCAYEVGVVQGCIKHKTWKPLVPLIKKRV